jgi:hypothetical protein
MNYLLPLMLGLVLAQDDGSGPENRPDPITTAYEQFGKSPGEKRAAIVAEIARRIEECQDAGVRHLLALRDRAVRELKIVNRQAPAYYDPALYAPQARRHFAEATDAIVAETAGRFDRVGSVPMYNGRISYDFGLNVGVDSGKDPSSDDVLWNYLYGYPPGADVLVAWLELKLDHDDTVDLLAEHFSHCYCDLEGTCFANLSLYDAFAAAAVAEQNIDMPDPDVIAFARLVLKDDSFVSPIPPDSRQRELFGHETDYFLRYFRHRTFVEYCANLLVNPEIPISYAHEQLRERILYCFHLDGRDLTKIRNRLIRYGDRGNFVNSIDKLTLEDPYWRARAQEVAAAENETRWVIARLAYDVLRAEGLYKE